MDIEVYYTLDYSVATLDYSSIISILYNSYIKMFSDFLGGGNILQCIYVFYPAVKLWWAKEVPNLVSSPHMLETELNGSSLTGNQSGL